MKRIFLGLAFLLLSVCNLQASQHDYVLDDQPGAAFRADLNSALNAIVTNNSGASEPLTLYPNMWWYDSSTGLLKHRNNANDAWITLGLDAADTDGTFSANSDSKVPTQKAAKTYVDGQVSTLNTSIAGKISKTTASELYGMAEKTTLSDNDVFLIEDSDASYGKKKVLKSNLIGSGIVRSQLFTSSGTWVCPAGVTKVLVTMSGGGAGGSGGYYNMSGGGGSGAETAKRIGIDVTPGNSYTITVGAAGTGGVGWNDGTDGGYSQFHSSAYRVLGGNKGVKATSVKSSTGGVAVEGNSMDASGQSAGDFDSTGSGKGAGGGGQYQTAGGGGGGSAFGRGGNGGGNNTDGVDATGYGAGGGGAGWNASVHRNGGDGSPGFVLIEYF